MFEALHRLRPPGRAAGTRFGTFEEFFCSAFNGSRVAAARTRGV